MTATRRLPGEWEPQDAVLLVWPRPEAGWAEHFTEVTTAYLDFIRAILRFETVLLIVPDQQTADQIQSQVTPAYFPLHTFIYQSNDSWARDFGPITVEENGEPLLLDFVFNGWGGKFPADRDNALTHALQSQKIFHANVNPLDWTLEGGSIESDGEGTLLTTTSCLLTDTRNKSAGREKTEDFLKQQFGLKRILWLENSWLDGDDTDGHVDMLARFCNADTIAYVQCSDKRDDHYPGLHAMEQELKKFSREDGMPYHLLPLPLPSPSYDEDGDRLPASYANFLIINNAVILPIYHVAEDEEAIRQLAKAFPGHEIVPVYATPFIRQSGSVHCLSMQLPAGVLQS